MKVDFIIDGFNLYHSLKRINKDNKTAKTKWLDLVSFSSSFLKDIEIPLSLNSGTAEVGNVYYFSALAFHLINKKTPEVEDKVSKHQKYIQALESSGAIVELGKFKYKASTYKSKKFYAKYRQYEEKETDVAMAVKLFEIFLKDDADIICLITADSDLVSAVRSVKANFSDKIIVNIVPYASLGEELQKACDLFIKVKKERVINNQFPEIIEKINVKNPFKN